MSEPTIDLITCQNMIRLRQYGDLFEYISPFLESALLKDRALLGLPGSDHVDNVMLQLANKLLRSDGHKLETYATWQKERPEKTFLDWLRIVRRNAVNDYMEQALRKGKTAAAEGSRLREVLVDVEDALGARRPRFTRYRLVRRIVEVAEACLPKPQLAALTLWLQGYGFADIGLELDCSGPDAKLLVDAAKVRLKRYFQDERDD